jgi:hypothetical protein
MSVYPGSLDLLVSYRIADLQREVQNDRLADQVPRPRRTLRIRLAEHLRAAAQWLEEPPQLAGA